MNGHNAALSAGRWLMFMPDLAGGGAQRTVVNVLRFWPSDTARPVLVVGHTAGPGKAWLDGAVEVIELGRCRLRDMALPLRRLIRAARPPVVFAAMALSNVVAAAVTRALPYRPALILSEVNSHRGHDGIAAWHRPLIRWALRRADGVIAQSRGLAAELVVDYGLPPDRVVGIHNPIDVGAVRRAAAVAKEPEPAHPTVVAAGRLVRQKGFDLLLPAFAALPIPNARLVILGEGPQRPALEAQAASLGIADRVSMPGFVSDPERRYAAADCFVLSSRWEGFGNVVVEALAAGAPVVATACPHGPDEIVRDGETGLLVPPGDIAALTNAIRRMLVDREFAQSCRAAAQRDVERFDAPRIARQYAETMSAMARAAR